MNGKASVPAVRPPFRYFECTVCCDKKRSAGVWIESNAVCVECVLESIIPQFHAALQYESSYPVKWSRGSPLKPSDFAQFFDDFPAFMQKWTAKEQEYKTPGPLRVYCKECTLFLGDRTTFTGDVVLCIGHDGCVCSRCGSAEKVHECKVGDNDDGSKGVEGVVRCRNGCLVTLEDGCNDVVCRCGAHLCAACGQADPPREHWNRGMPCPRFSGGTKPLYNEDVVEEGGAGAAELQRFVQTLLDVAAPLGHLAAIHPRDRTATPAAPAMPEEFRAANLPLPPTMMIDAHGQTVFRPEAALQIRRAQREIVANHRQTVQNIINTWQDVERDLRALGFLIAYPDLVQRLRDVAAALIPNLDPLRRIRSSSA